MLPFIKILGFQFPMYGLFTALGYIAGILYCLRRRRSAGLSKEQVLDIIFYLIAGAALGGKLFYILFYWHDFAAAAWIDKIRYGFVFLGGLTGALLAGIYIIKRNKLPLLKTADFFAPAIPLGHAIGKIGCFMAGCCYGKVSSIGWLSVRFYDPKCLVPEYLHGVPLYPVQLIESFISFMLFLALFWLTKRKHRPGTIIASYIIGFGILRFAAEFFRGEDEIYILGITQNQITALVLILLAAVFLWWRRKYGAAK